MPTRPFPRALREWTFPGCAAAALLLTGAAASADPSPLPADPAIQTLVDMVSPDSLESHVAALAGFHNRNTVSDTLSATQGIGAARNWVLAKFQEIADDNGGNLEPGFFLWEHVVCTVLGSHKNVVAELPGQTDPSRIFVVGGHLDSRTINVCDATNLAHGANDDASGVAAALEMARLLSTTATDNTVIFQAFSGEEQGLIGSGHYALDAVLGGVDIEGMIGNDIIGNINGCPDSPDCGGGQPTDVDSLSVRAFAGDTAEGKSRQLARLAKLMAAAYVPEMTVHLIPALDRPGRGGDHIPFHNLGYASIRFIETLEFTGRQHNSADQIPFMDFNYLTRNTKINLALMANLAMAPPTPSGVEVFDQGTGGSILVTWSSPAALGGDVAGYRVAYRFADAGDTLFYADILDAGSETSLAVSGLTDEIRLAVGVSAYDGDGHESIFSEERFVTPGIAPHSPQAFTVASLTDRLRLTWAPAQELDIAVVRIERSLDEESGYTVLDSVEAGTEVYDDASVDPGTFYYYKITSVDTDGFTSPTTAPDKGRLAEHETGILIVDASRDGSGSPGNPTDETVDDFYDAIFAGIPILAHWDWIEQFDGLGVLMTDADMALYQTVFIHSDRNNGTIAADTTEIRQYVDNGGQVWISGWELRKSLGGVSEDLGVFGSDSFMRDVIHVDSLRRALLSEQDFEGATAAAGGYPDLTVDAVKYPFAGGHLFGQDAVVGDLPDMGATTPLYTYRSNLGAGGSNHGLVDGLMHPGVNPTLVFTDFPLYFMETEGVEALANKILEEFGYSPGAAGEPGSGADLLFDPVGPNPLRPGTEMAFTIPRSGPVELRVIDVSGRVVRTLLDEKVHEAGRHRVSWDGRDGSGHDVASGIYFAVLEAGGERRVRRMAVVR